MNKVILMGRLTKDPEVRYSQGQNSMAVARFTLAVNRRFAKDGEQSADFINCVSFGKTAEFAEKYFRQGTKICISGRIQTGSYTNRDGQKVYTTDVVIEEQDFAESKASQDNRNSTQNSYVPNYNAPNNYAASNRQGNGYQTGNDGFMNIPDGIDEELPFC